MTRAHSGGEHSGVAEGRRQVVDEVWAFIRDRCPPVTAKGETTISVDALFAVIEPELDDVA